MTQKLLRRGAGESSRPIRTAGIEKPNWITAFNLLPDWDEEDIETLTTVASIVPTVADYVQLVVRQWLRREGYMKHLANVTEQLEFLVAPAGKFYEGFFATKTDELCFYAESLTCDKGNTVDTAWRIVREHLQLYGFLKEKDHGRASEGTEGV